MSDINKIVFECVDTALSGFDSIDKTVFYQYLKDKQSVDREEFADKFEVVHEALRVIFGINHYKIERVIIQTLNKRAKQGIYERNLEVAAFGCMVNVFIEETERNLKRNKSLHALSNYAKGLEAKVKETDEKLKASERLAAIGETAAMVGHDIRNPLQAIVGELYMQRSNVSSLPEGTLKSELQDSIKSIEENIFYINKIVSDLQDYAKPLNADAEAIDINTVIADVLSIVPIPANLQVHIDVGKGFTLFYANYQMLKRALSNLVQNAVQAMPDGGRLTISTTTKNGALQIAVEDTGDGIPEDVKPRLFKPLFTTKSKGQGLGLAVVKRLVEAQGGIVWFESENGEGAKFIMEFPTLPKESLA